MEIIQCVLNYYWFIANCDKSRCRIHSVLIKQFFPMITLNSNVGFSSRLPSRGSAQRGWFWLAPMSVSENHSAPPDVTGYTNNTANTAADGIQVERPPPGGGGSAAQRQTPKYGNAELMETGDGEEEKPACCSLSFFKNSHTGWDCLSCESF